jgi:hypothetical protein
MGRKRKHEVSLSLELQKQLVRGYTRQQEEIFQLKRIIREQRAIIGRYSKPAALAEDKKYDVNDLLFYI